MPKKDELPQELTDRIAREENEQDVAAMNRLGRKIADLATPKAFKDVAKYISKSEFDTDKRKFDTGETTNPMGDKYAKGGKVSTASKRADGCCIKGITRGKMV